VAERLPPVEKDNDTIHDKISKDFKFFIQCYPSLPYAALHFTPLFYAKEIGKQLDRSEFRASNG
jgi:hypothetical protein